MLKFSSKLRISIEDKQYISKCLPTNWQTDVLEAYPSKDFEVFIRVNAKTVEGALMWISNYQEINNSSYSVETTYKCAGQRLLFKRRYHCQHKTKHKDTYDPMYRKNIKNTNCPSAIIVAIRTVNKKRFQGKDQSRAPDVNKPCEVRLKLKHNHCTNNHMALKFKKVLPTVTEELIRLYKAGHSAATAVQSIKAQIRLNFENCEEILTDRSKCPDYSYFYYIYQKTFNTENPKEFNKTFLEATLKEYNEKQDFEAARIVFTTNGFVIGFCPPLIHRVHQNHVNSSEIVFVDSFSTCEKNGARIFVLLTQSDFGGLPLGLIIVNNNSKNDTLVGFNIIKDMLGQAAFGGNLSGPQIVITNDYLCDNQVCSVWPKSKRLLSWYHVLQNVYKWLQALRHGILIADRFVLMKDFYNLMFASNETELLEKYEFAKINSSKYSNYLKLLQSYFEKRHLWAQCYRPNIPNFKSNYCEFILRTLREKIFKYIKTFNLVQFVDFAIQIYFPYFEQQLLDIALNRNIRNIFYCKLDLPNETTLNKIQNMGCNIRLVPSDTVKDIFYMVNSNLLTCTCSNGSYTLLCEHLKCVLTQIYTENLNKLKNNRTRCQCYYLATGQQLELVDCHDETTDSIESTTSSLLFEEYVAMDTEEIDIDQYVTLKNKEDSITECKDGVQKINNKLEEFLQNDPENLLPALQILYSRFRAVSNVSDICTVFCIEDNKKQ